MLWLEGRAARVTWTVLVFAAALGLVYLLRQLLLLLAFSLFLAYLIWPLVRLVERWRPLSRRRTLAISVVYLGVLAGLTAVGAVVGPRLTGEVSALAEKLPQMSQQIQSGEIVREMLARRGWEVEQVRDLERFLRTNAGTIIGYAHGALAGLLGWLAGAWVVVLVPIFAFFILKDADQVGASLAALVADRAHRRLWTEIVQDLHLLLGRYVRALVLLALVTFVVWSALFLLAGVPYALVLAAIGGALEFIPVLGPLLGGVIVVGVALFSAYPHPWLLAAFVLLWRLVQDYVSSPLIMGRGIDIHPALVIFGVIAGGEIGGPAGMFLSVPVIAGLRVVWRRLRAAEHS